MATLDKSPRGGNFEVPTLPTLRELASQRLESFSRLTGIFATSMKKRECVCSVRRRSASRVDYSYVRYRPLVVSWGWRWAFWDRPSAPAQNLAHIEERSQGDGVVMAKEYEMLTSELHAQARESLRLRANAASSAHALMTLKEHLQLVKSEDILSLLARS